MKYPSVRSACLLSILCIASLLCSFNLNADAHHPQAFLDNVAGTSDEGTQIVQHYCASCHADKPLIPIGAPRTRNQNDWAPRLKQGLDALFHHADEGFNAMPPRGGCFECTDDQLRLAIQALLPLVKNK